MNALGKAGLMIDATKALLHASRLVVVLTGCLILSLNSFGQPSHPPSISAIPDQGIYPNSTNRPIRFIVGDPETPATLLTLTGMSSNTNLIPTSGIIFGGSGSNRTATIIPATNQTGTATISITVSDADGGSASNSFALHVDYFSMLTNSFQLLREASAVWGDYDNDGLLDALIVGNGEAHLYHNDGSNAFTEVNAGLTNGNRGIAAWVDYNRDGRLDIVLTAGKPRFYRNDGNGIFTFVNPGLPIIQEDGNFGAMAWGDFDNDGDLDVALSGRSPKWKPIPVIYRHEVNATFTDIKAGLPENYGGSLDWGDFDNDGDLDLLISGREAANFAKIYRNDNGSFVEEPVGLTDVYSGSARWGDFDNDGDLDILLTGSFGQQARIYRNDSGTFTDIAAPLAPVRFGESRWADFDSDGFLDVLLTGMTIENTPVTRLYRNNLNQTFSETEAVLTNIYNGSTAWGDMDNDGDLDLLLMGYGCDRGCTALQLGRNNAPSNSPPSVPINLSTEDLPNNQIGFRWSPSTDAQSAVAGLSYNLRLGTTPGGTEVVSPEADPVSGRRRVAEPGRIHTNRWRLRDLPKGTYYWAVQAIDSTLAGSAFSAEQAFTVTNTAPSIDVVPEVRVGPSVPITIDVTVTDAESPSTELSLSALSATGDFIPQSSVLVQGASAQRTVTFTVGTGQFGTNLLVLRATDPFGRYRDVPVRVVSELFTILTIPGSTNFASLAGLQIGWGDPHSSPVVDVDRDGDLDVLMKGTYWTSTRVINAFVVASNGGSGNFTFNILSNVTMSFPSSSYALDDFNRDGIVDILAGGDLFAGNGLGGFLPAQNLATGLASMFADIDGDGDLDALAFTSGSGWYRNDGGLLRLRPASALAFGTHYEPTAAQATDLDRDGDVDFFKAVTGTNSEAALLVMTFKNNGRAQFTSGISPILVPGASELYWVRCFDANDDGTLDVIFNYSSIYASAYMLGLASNDGIGHFYFASTNIAPGMFGGDFDNDGDIDRWVDEKIPSYPYTKYTRLYLKTGLGQYQPQSLSLSEPGLEGDFDGDGDLDYIVSTEQWDEFGRTISQKQWRFLRNNCDRTNLPPPVPTGLTATQRNDDRITFAWNAAPDDHTPANLVTYNVRVGTTPGGIDILAPCASPVTGRRWLSAAGNAGPVTFHDLRSLPAGTYYWSVQAIDGVFAPSAWAAEESITIDPPSISALPDIVTPPGIASKPISFSVTGGASPIGSLTITVVADDPALVPTGGLVVSGTGAQRTLTITPGNSSGDTELTVTVTDTAGFSAVRRCHLRVAWWDAQQPIPQTIIQNSVEWHWADMDLDGRLDLFGHMPANSSGTRPFAFRNLGRAQFTSNYCNLPSSLDYAVQIADFGGDNLPDMFTRQLLSINTASFRIWKGSGASFQFTAAPATTNRSEVASPLWVDLDNDGWRDVTHFGWVNSPPSGLLVARGNPDGTFTYLPQRIILGGTSIAAGDFDSDGDFDLAVSGVSEGTHFTRLYLNRDHGDFVPVSAGLPQGSYHLSAADLDGDSRPDLLLNPSDRGSANRPHLMHNVGGSFVELASDLPKDVEPTAWADFDNDGDLDLLAKTSEMLSTGVYQYNTALFRNDGGVLMCADSGLPAIVMYAAEFADADNDGDLDLVISGRMGGNAAGYLCLNTSTRANTPPPAPTNPISAPGNASMLLQWTPVADAESGTALTYNLRLGTSPGGSEIVAPVADTATGQRRLTGPGNIGGTPRRRLLLPDGTYYWSVQAVDAGFAASPFTTEDSFSCYHPTISTFTKVRLYPGAASAVQSFTVADIDSATTALTLSAYSTDPVVLPPERIIFGGSGSTRTVSLQSVPRMVGTSVVSVVVTDVTGLTATNSFVFEAAYFTEIASGLPSGNNLTPAFADYDNDGDLDVYLGDAIYRNDGAFNFTRVVTVTATAQRNGVTWGDFDRDGDLDLAVVGVAKTFIYRNDGANVFTDISAGIPAASNAAIAWGDYDRDGDLDLLSLAAHMNGLSRIYRNDGAAGFFPVNANLPAATESGAAWGDFDNDGDLDVLMAGFIGTGTTLGGVFSNNGDGTFSDIGATIPRLYGAAVAWGDYDNDGFLDAVVAGDLWNTFQLQIYHNNRNGTFTETNIGLPGAAHSSVQWVDFDNDGDVDLLCCGKISKFPNLEYATYLYRNNGDGTFTDTLAGLPKASMAAWSDVDSDSDLDLLLIGPDGVTCRFFKNDCSVSNTLPSAPTGLTATLLPHNDVLLSWSPSTDSENTNASVLSYNVRIGTTSGGSQIMSPASADNGYHRVPNFGNAGPTNFWVIANLTNGNYYWSVQVIDSAFAGSMFAAEGSFTVSRPLISPITNRTVPLNTVLAPIAFTVSGAETAAADLIVTVTSSDTNLVTDAGLVLNGVGTARTLTITPAANRSGVTTITITALDESGLGATHSFLLTVEQFVDIAAGFTGAAGAAAWGDFDNDGDLDLVRGTTIYRNDGGAFLGIGTGFPTATGVWSSWGDADNDGSLDLILSGIEFTQVLRNNGNSRFTPIAGNLPGNVDSECAWGDYDNDGDLDFLQAYPSATSLFRNNATNNFTSLSIGLPIVNPGSVAWGDYDNDGDLDILMVGGMLLRIYRNDGNGSFADLGANLPGIYNSTASWGDFDNDGDLDFVVAGSTNYYANGVVTRIYRNTGNPSPTLAFTNLYPNQALGPVGIWKGTVAWGDCDNDGDLDLLVTGETTNSAALTKIYRNDGGWFTDSGLPLPALKNSFAAWGDYDNDGSLDLALSGKDPAGASLSRIYRNHFSGVSNTPPAAPVNLTNVTYGKSIHLSWNVPSDPNQPSGLSYNLRVGTSPGAADIVNPLSASTGARKVAALGNANERQSWTVTNLAGGTYFWSVQAVDHSFAGSAFAEERSIFVTNLAPVAVSISATTIEDGSAGITLSGSDPDNEAVTFTVASQPLFGRLSGTPPSVTYRPATNYFGSDQFTYYANDRLTSSAPASVFITVTPVEDVAASKLTIAPAAAGQYQLSLVAEPWRSYRLEASTDLVHWIPITNFLGTNLLTQFIDADAPNHPLRFYRAALFTFGPTINSGPKWFSNQFQFCVTGETGRAHQLQASTNLIDWSLVGVRLMTNGLSPFVDRDVQNSSQHYRRVLAP